MKVGNIRLAGFLHRCTREVCSVSVGILIGQV